jgi:tetratricopeptide (TPR) repeat protein
VNRGLVQAEQGEFEKALADLEEALQGWPGIGIARVNLGYTYELMGRYTEAAATYRNTSHFLGVNNHAWVLATCPDEKYRNGEQAVQLAKKACDATRDREGMYLDTLAAAYAENGKFEDAVKAQEKALTDKSYVIKYGEEGQKRLQLYKAKKPFRTEPVKK